mmetsp:Transcript_16229/g.33161  ORF Transcript_16229/g.33161 Transcript_16229/m.33161 type:complete len:240 (-) Transcript_16229:347-1066(-)
MIVLAVVSVSVVSLSVSVVVVSLSVSDVVPSFISVTNGCSSPWTAIVSPVVEVIVTENVCGFSSDDVAVVVEVVVVVAEYSDDSDDSDVSPPLTLAFSLVSLTTSESIVVAVVVVVVFMPLFLSFSPTIDTSRDTVAFIQSFVLLLLVLPRCAVVSVSASVAVSYLQSLKTTSLPCVRTSSSISLSISTSTSNRNTQKTAVTFVLAFVSVFMFASLFDFDAYLPSWRSQIILPSTNIVS